MTPILATPTETRPVSYDPQVPPVPDELVEYLFENSTRHYSGKSGDLAELAWQWFHEHYPPTPADMDYVDVMEVRKAEELTDRLARAEATIERVKAVADELKQSAKFCYDWADKVADKDKHEEFAWLERGNGFKDSRDKLLAALADPTDHDGEIRSEVI